MLLVLVVRARPSIGETALAVDAEGGSGDALASALAFAQAMPATAGPAGADDDETIVVGEGFELGAAEARFVRRQRRDAVGRLRTIEPGLFRPAPRASGPRWSRWSPACSSSRRCCCPTRRTP